MALTRKFLMALGIEDAKIEEIITAHTEVTDALKKERDNFRSDAERLKTEADKVPEMQRALDAYKANGEMVSKESFDSLKKDYDEYKVAVEAREAHHQKETAFRKLLSEVNISDKRYDSIVKVSDIDKLELENGQIRDKDKLAEQLKTEWADFIVTTSQVGAQTASPPQVTNVDYSSMSDEEYYRTTYEANKKKG